MRIKENTGFTCRKCRRKVSELTNGSYRNHCPFCLYSLHIDNVPGDRKNTCLNLMEPVEYRFSQKKGYQIKHRCIACKKEQWNKIAENTEQPDLFLEFVEKRNGF